MNIFLGIIIGLFVLLVLVTAHEFGHFIMARKNGVRVLEFGIGFPPRAIAWVKDKKSGKWKRLPKSERGKPQESLIFSLNYLPIGGFCQMDGESAIDDRKGTFGNARFWSKTKILFGGVAMNWLISFIVLTILAWTGMPAFIDHQFTIAADTRIPPSPVIVSDIFEDSPAAVAGLQIGDTITHINDIEISSPANFTEINNTFADQEVSYTVSRTSLICPEESTECSDEEKIPTTTVETISATLNPVDSDFRLGIAMESQQNFAYSTWSAPIVGAGLTLQLTGETIKGIGDMLWNLISGLGSQLSLDPSVRDAGRESISAVGDSVTGPIGIIGVIFPAFTSSGPANIAFLAAIISVSLACLNILPIPALDGGRWLLMAIYKLRKKKLTKELEEKIVARAFMSLLALMVIVTILDIIRIAK